MFGTAQKMARPSHRVLCHFGRLRLSAAAGYALGCGGRAVSAGQRRCGICRCPWLPSMEAYAEWRKMVAKEAFIYA